MRKGLKKWAVAAVAAVTAMAMCVPAYAVSYKAITNLKFTCSDFEEPVAGEDIGDISISAPASAYYDITECYYDVEHEDTWERGAIPVVYIELEVKSEYEDDYRFTKLSKTNVSLSGCHATYSSSSTADSKRTCKIKFKLRKVGGDLTDIDENYWEGRTAEWTEVDDADKYEVKLYRGSRNVTTVTTSQNHYNFYPDMTSAGDYTFKVRAVSNSDGEKSEWTDQSEEYYMNSANVYKGGNAGTGDGNYTGGPNGGSTGGPTGGSMNGGWNQNQYGWYYVQGDGNLVKNNWIFVDNNWFFLDGNGYMMTGLQLVGNQWFYLNPNSDGTKGAMLTGVQMINGGIYYFNPISDGSKGAMLTGYQNINNKWYFFDPSNGILWANATTPNGKWCDAAGVVQMN